MGVKTLPNDKRARWDSSFILLRFGDSVVAVLIGITVVAIHVQDSLTHILQQALTQLPDRLPNPHEGGKGSHEYKEETDILHSSPSSALASAGSRHATQIPPVPGREGKHGLEDADKAKRKEPLDKVLGPRRRRFPVRLPQCFNICHHACNGIGDGTDRVEPEVEEGICHETQEEDAHQQDQHCQAGLGPFAA
ncbi:hypothetical protein CCMA1212_006383 [Trichoderma ghanense]|uniref:Uncharacterized protein n=1 Tax=Trichoderma ghanense TaxID=65468 RepID=A0ABY2H0N9_9HYPO